MQTNIIVKLQPTIRHINRISSLTLKLILFITFQLSRIKKATNSTGNKDTKKANASLCRYSTISSNKI